MRIRDWSSDVCSSDRLQHQGEYACQMRHVANGIIDLSLVERPPSPIREACALIKADRQIGVYKIGITDLFALAQRHCRDLGVEHGMGRLAREIMDNLDRKSGVEGTSV